MKEFTVVADTAMISMDNINELTDNNINYIVGARLGNISAELLEAIDKNICREDGKSIRLKTDLGYMVCGYSSARYRKELHEMNNQIEKARLVVEQPSKTKKLKFIQTKNQKVVLNEKLIKKTKKTLGIKGYYTNLPLTVADDKTIISRYHELYRIEKAFRISKHIELQTGISVKRYVSEAKKIVDGQLLNQITNKIVTVKAQPTERMKGDP